MKYILRKDDYVTTRWSGGTTTQLAIWPSDAVYAERNFIWRISSAVVEDEYSSFTALPSVARIITPLIGSLELSHNGGAPFVLAPYETNCFWGDWQTKSKGKVTDFNLMMKAGAGKMDSFSLSAGSTVSLESFSADSLSESEMAEFFPKLDFPLNGDIMVSELLYMCEGDEAVFRASGTEEYLHRGDSVLLQGESASISFEFRNPSSKDCRWMHVIILHPLR